MCPVSTNSSVRILWWVSEWPRLFFYRSFVWVEEILLTQSTKSSILYMCACSIPHCIIQGSQHFNSETRICFLTGPYFVALLPQSYKKCLERCLKCVKVELKNLFEYVMNQRLCISVYTTFWNVISSKKTYFPERSHDRATRWWYNPKAKKVKERHQLKRQWLC